MTQRWRMAIELTWDIDPKDIEEKYPGDAEVDFARRALERVRSELEKLLQGSFAHYHILEMPERKIDR